ncbi:MAG: hypothetical protein KDM63_04745 [Verrucomicrobiae bacterium]|nr:hypothetical protein [Verrucomicrobiae bacterium]
MAAKAKAWFGEGFRPVPVAAWEWFLMRLGFALVAFFDFANRQPFQYSGQPVPVGLAKWIDLTWLNQPWAYPVFVTLAGVGLLSYVSGYGLVVSLPALTLLHTLMRTYENSQGSIHHSHHMITLVLLVQSVVVVTLRLRTRKRSELFDDSGELSERSWLLYYTQGAVAATYVIAALSKAINSKLMWVWNSPYVAFDFVKAQRQQYYKLLDPQFAGETVAAEWVLAHPMLARIGFGGAFFLELFALVALKNRPWAFWTGLAIIGLHCGITWIMHLRFINNEMVLLIFFVNLPWWVWRFASRRDRIPALS